MQKGQTFIGYPVLVDEAKRWAWKFLIRKAELQYQAGLIRLFQLQQRKECTYALKNMPKNDVLEHVEEYKNDLLT